MAAEKRQASFVYADGSVCETEVQWEPMRPEDDAERARIHAEWRAREDAKRK